MIERIAILGTGLLGTSAGLALRAAGFHGSITGWNRSAEGAREALSMGAIDSIAPDPVAGRAREPGCAAVRAHLRHARLHGAACGRARARNTWSPTWAAPRRRSRPRRGACSTLPIARRFFPGIPWRARSAAARRWGMPTSFAARCGCLPMIPSWQRSPRGAELVKAGASGWWRWARRPSILTRRGTTNWWPGSAICRSLWLRR